MSDGAPWPTEIRVLRAARLVEVDYDDGRSVSLPAELLRVESPSAEVQGHGPSQKVTVSGKRDVAVERAEPVGNYAARLVFSDGHDTGIYSWAELRRLGENQEAIWDAYLAALEAKGLSRDG